MTCASHAWRSSLTFQSRRDKRSLLISLSLPFNELCSFIHSVVVLDRSIITSTSLEKKRTRQTILLSRCSVTFHGSRNRIVHCRMSKDGGHYSNSERSRQSKEWESRRCSSRTPWIEIPMEEYRWSRHSPGNSDKFHREVQRFSRRRRRTSLSRHWTDRWNLRGETVVPRQRPGTDCDGWWSI